MIAKACETYDGVLVCADTTQAQRVAREYGIKTIPLGQLLEKSIGQCPKIAFDTHAVERIVHDYEVAINKLKLDAMNLKDKIASQQMNLNTLQTNYNLLMNTYNTVKNRLEAKYLKLAKLFGKKSKALRKCRQK